MATTQHYTTEEDSRTIELIKVGIENCLSQTPTMLAEALSKYFGDAEITFKENTPKENTITFHCINSKWSANKYHRIFVVTYDKYNEKEFKAIEIREITAI